MKIQDLEKRIAVLEAEIAKLKAQKPEWHYHYHYQQPIYQPTWVSPPVYVPTVWMGAGLHGQAGTTLVTNNTAYTYGPEH